MGCSSQTEDDGGNDDASGIDSGSGSGSDGVAEGEETKNKQAEASARSGVSSFIDIRPLPALTSAAPAQAPARPRNRRYQVEWSKENTLGFSVLRFSRRTLEYLFYEVTIKAPERAGQGQGKCADAGASHSGPPCPSLRLVHSIVTERGGSEVVV